VKILVTGGAGFIGSHVVDAYVELGHDVLIVDDLSTGRSRNLNPAARLYELDIRSPEVAALIAQERPDVINHHAAQIDVRKSVADPVDDLTRNTAGSVNLIEAARGAGVAKFIYISSGGAIYGEPEILPCPEDHPIKPLSPYGVSKHTTEHYLELYAELYDLRYTTLRYANVYGPRQDPHGEAGVVAIFTDRTLHGEPLTIYGDGSIVRDFVYAGDVKRANVLALDRGDDTALNIGTGVLTSVNEVFHQLRIATGYQHEPIYAPSKAGDLQRNCLNVELAARVLGWEPEVDFATGIALTVAAMRAEE
jgi:UDP-glucose 4-epimerase